MFNSLPFSDLFRQEPHLAYVTAAILLLACSALGYLLFDLYRRNRQLSKRGNTPVASPVHLPSTVAVKRNLAQLATRSRRSAANIWEVSKTWGARSVVTGKKAWATWKEWTKDPYATPAAEADAVAVAKQLEKLPVVSGVEVAAPRLQPVIDENIPGEPTPVIDNDNELLLTNYQPNAIFTSDAELAPVQMPSHTNCIIQRSVSIERQPLKKPVAFFAQQLEQYLPQCKVRTDQALVSAAGTFPVAIALQLSTKHSNIFIDVEIDIINAQGRHEERDAFFTDRGWIVVRLTEQQVLTDERECIAFIGRVISSVVSSFRIQAFTAHVEKELQPEVHAVKSRQA